MNNLKLKVEYIIIFFIFSTILLFFVSWDSYLYDISIRIDSAWFFTCGRAWMNGLIPYKDFADSKGPLLWLIYGIGYKISNNDYIGVFWLSVLFYTFSFYYIRKIANIFIEEKNKTLLCSFAMAFFFFLQHIHDETRAEDFCQLFICIAMYHTCNILYTNITNQKLKESGFATGFCIGATLLIKYNITIIISSIVVFCWINILKNKQNIVKYILFQLCGFSCIILPFILYFIYLGNLEDFIREYFISTFKTIQNINGIDGKNNLFATFRDNYKIELSFIISLLLSLYCSIRLLNKYRYFPFVCTAIFVCMLKSVSRLYYLESIAIFYVFGIIYITKICTIRYCNTNFFSFIFSAIVIFSTYCSNALFWNKKIYGCTIDRYNEPSQYRENFYRQEYMLAQVKNAMVLYYRMHDYGFGIYSEVLPACKYWAEQAGCTKEMKDIQDNCIKSKKADFIFINKKITYSKEDIYLLEHSGYYKYDLFSGNDTRQPILYSKHKLALFPLKRPIISNRNILLKNWKCTDVIDNN